MDRQRLVLREPAIYEIHLQGTLDESWGDYFGGQVVSTTEGACRPAVTVLRTPLVDQAALVGLVSRLNGLGLLILLIEHMCVERNTL